MKERNCRMGFFFFLGSAFGPNFSKRLFASSVVRPPSLVLHTHRLGKGKANFKKITYCINLRHSSMSTSLISSELIREAERDLSRSALMTPKPLPAKKTKNH